MKYLKSFYPSLAMISPPQINSKITNFISRSNYSPPSSGKGWGRGWKALVSRLGLPFTISPLIINHAMPKIVSSRNCVGIALLSRWMNFAKLMPLWCNSVRVVPLIARGWRGTSLPRVSIHKEIQRRRCWAFSVKACLLWNLLWRMNQKRRNTYGVVPRTTYANPG